MSLSQGKRDLNAETKHLKPDLTQHTTECCRISSVNQPGWLIDIVLLLSLPVVPYQNDPVAQHLVLFRLAAVTRAVELQGHISGP